MTLLETIIAIVLIAVLLSILLPALTSARTHTQRDKCAENQRRIGQAWHAYLNDHNQQFPVVPVQPGWFYGGVRFSAVNDTATPDFRRPLTAYLGVFRTNDTRDIVWCCPADHGISDPRVSTTAARRTAFRSYGTSYRCNAALVRPRAELDAASTIATQSSVDANPQPPPLQPQRYVDVWNEGGLQRAEITTAPSRLLLGGDPVWFEVAESTGHEANWHGVKGSGNLLFLDGSVRFLSVRPRHIVGPVVFDPRMKGSVANQPE